VEDPGQAAEAEPDAGDVPGEARGLERDRRVEIRPLDGARPGLDRVLDQAGLEAQLVRDGPQEVGDHPWPREDDGAVDGGWVQVAKDREKASTWTAVPRRVVQEKNTETMTQSSV
jgi:hypothetical protein